MAAGRLKVWDATASAWTYPGGTGSLSVSDGSTTVDPASSVVFTGAFVSDLGSNEAGVTVETIGLDIRAYGASTGSADNATAIQAALDEALATGLPLYIPAGTWLTSPLTYAGPVSPGVGSTLSILGAGQGQSTLQPVAGAGTVLTLSGPLRGCRFKDFGINGTGGTGNGLYYSDTGSPNYIYDSVFENLEITNCALTGLYIKSGFANRYVHIWAAYNLHDQIKVWGDFTDYFERIDIYTTYSTYAGIRCIRGGSFVAFNGIYDTAQAAGPLLRFGGDGSAESDGLTAYPNVNLLGGRVEAFTIGVELVVAPGSAFRMTSVDFQTASGVANCRAVNLLNSAVSLPMLLAGCAFELIGGATWQNGYAIHGQLPVVDEGSNAALSVWSDSAGLAYPALQRLFGANSANESSYGYKGQVLTGLTDVAYLGSEGLGNPNDGTQRHRTSARAMPSSGAYVSGDIVDNATTVSELGSVGSKYTLIGWRRLTTGSSHVLNTDWVERREPTGN